MESYKHPFIPPSTIIRINDSITRKRARPEATEKEIQRREKMSGLFIHLQSLVPTLKGNKATKEEIVSNTIEHIKFLEGEKKRLETIKESSEVKKTVLSQCTNLASSVHVTASNGVAFFGIQLHNKKAMMTKIFKVFEKHCSEVLTASINVNEEEILTLTATVVLRNNGGDDTIEKLKKDILIL